MLQAILDTVLSSRQGSYTEQINYDNVDANRLPGIDLDFGQDLDMDFWMNLEDHPLLAWPDLAQEA